MVYYTTKTYNLYNPYHFQEIFANGDLNFVHSAPQENVATNSSLPIYGDFFNSEYYLILIFLIVSSILSGVIFTISYVLSTKSIDKEKVSAYECGFNPFEDARNQFDVRFYLVAILFIIFDLEVSFLFPWAVTLNKLSIFGFWSMFVFLLVLTVGFIYEWKKGALEWE